VRKGATIRVIRAALLGMALATLSCGGGEMGPSGGPPLQLSLSANSVAVGQDGKPASVTVTLTRPAGDTNSVSVTASNVPSGVKTQIQSPGTGNTGTVTFAAETPGAPSAGAYSVTINGTEGATTATANLSLVIAVVATVKSTVNGSAGLNGRLSIFMSTSFQPTQTDYQFFTTNPGATATLEDLHPQHIRLQPKRGGTPEKADQSWDFSILDAVLNPVIGVADKSPELQLATAPGWMADSNGHLEVGHFQDFAEYSADVVRYYNTTTGFIDSGGNTHVHSTSKVTPVTWWGIFNEPNANGLSAADYVHLYNVVVPAMLEAVPAMPLKFVAVELADFGNQPETYMPTFVSGVAAQVDAVATHLYSTCNQQDSDEKLLGTIPGFVTDVNYIYSQLRSSEANSQLATVPVWVTENNVDADFATSDGTSACNPGRPFVTDQRGTSAFFAAWRPYVFSQLAQAGVGALYQWDFDGDMQFGEVSVATGKTYLSYWVDYYLERYFSLCPQGAAACSGAPPSILNLANTETASVEAMATENPDGSVVVMIADHAAEAPSDNNGPGAPRTVIVDVSALQPFASGTLLTIDATTDPANGPTSVPITPAPRLTITLNGYGVAFLEFKP